MKYLIIITSLVLGLTACGDKNRVNQSTATKPSATDTIVQDGGGDFGGGDYHSEKLEVSEAKQIIEKAYQMMPGYMNGLFAVFLNHGILEWRDSVFEETEEYMSAEDKVSLAYFSKLGFGIEEYQVLMNEIAPMIFFKNEIYKRLESESLKVVSDDSCYSHEGKKKSGSSHVDGEVCIRAKELAEQFDRWTAFPAALGLIAHELLEKIDPENETEELRADILQKSFQLFVPASDIGRAIDGYSSKYFSENLHWTVFYQPTEYGDYRSLVSCDSRPKNFYDSCEAFEDPYPNRCKTRRFNINPGNNFRNSETGLGVDYAVLSLSNRLANLNLRLLQETQEIQLGEYSPLSPEDYKTVIQTYEEMRFIIAAVESPLKKGVKLADEYYPSGSSQYLNFNAWPEKYYEPVVNCERINEFEKVKEAGIAPDSRQIQICKVFPNFKLNKGLYLYSLVEDSVDRINVALKDSIRMDNFLPRAKFREELKTDLVLSCRNQ